MRQNRPSRFCVSKLESFQERRFHQFLGQPATLHTRQVWVPQLFSKHTFSNFTNHSYWNHMFQLPKGRATTHKWGEKTTLLFGGVFNSRTVRQNTCKDGIYPFQSLSSLLKQKKKKHKTPKPKNFSLKDFPSPKGFAIWREKGKQITSGSENQLPAGSIRQSFPCCPPVSTHYSSSNSYRSITSVTHCDILQLVCYEMSAKKFDHILTDTIVKIEVEETA